MRNNIIHQGVKELTYEIRGVLDFAQKLKDMGVLMSMENIGDPIAKGEVIPDWIKEVVAKESKDNKNYGYCPTKGLLETRQYISKMREKEGISLDSENILFFNGLGDAVATIYNFLNKNSRVIGPSPAYPTHSSAEGAHSGSPHITYTLNSQRNWLPDIEDLENKIKYNEAIAGILIINPDNPTGIVYPEVVLRKIVEIARKYDLFLVCDEIYANLCFDQESFVPLASVLDGVPAIIMRGISKDLPWPGARCGWIEVYNKEKDKNFSDYVNTVIKAKSLEVCATTIPQKVIPKIFEDKRFKKYLKERRAKYARKAEFVYKIFRDVGGIKCVKPEGAFYACVVFDEGVLNNKQTLPIKDEKVKEITKKACEGAENGKKFVQYMMASYGICTVPLSGFNSHLEGFRVTLLEENEEKFKENILKVRDAIREYILS